jgi:catechol 2,3-dioxygenase-like lactoylglutathione lyase family enzyme
MLGAERLMAFVATSDAPRAKTFYRDTLGLRLVGETDFALVFLTGEGGRQTLRVQKVQSFTPAPFTALGWEVSDIQLVVEQLAAKGIQLSRYDFIPQDERGIWTTPDGARVAWFKDPDGNTLSLTQHPVPSR